jgi:ABC-2 type transport system ATP-binding protein
MPPGGGTAILAEPVPRKPRTKGASVIKVKERAALGLGRSNARPVEARGLVKRYGELTAVDRVDLTIERGDVYAFLGPNGAGKTTTLRMLLGLIHRDAGSISLFGRDPGPDPIRALAGVAGIIEEPRFYPYLSGRANLELLAALDRGGVGTREIDEILELVELRERAGNRVGEYSQGMRQRLGLASCLIRRPRLLLLDEPANGVDPAGIRFLRALLRRLGDEGMTIVLSSHLLSEVQEVCNRVAVINDGRIVHEGSLAELEAGAGSSYRLRTTDTARAEAALQALRGVRGLRRDHDELVFAFVAGEGDAVALTRALADAGVGVRELVREQTTLEELFFRLTESHSDGGREPEAAAA